MLKERLAELKKKLEEMPKESRRLTPDQWATIIQAITLLIQLFMGGGGNGPTPTPTPADPGSVDEARQHVDALHDFLDSLKPQGDQADAGQPAQAK